jgi:hypothetical protein
MGTRIFALLAALAVFLASAPLAAAPRAELWSHWLAYDPSSTTTVDHSHWNRLLRTYVFTAPDGINRFAYRRVTAEDRKILEDYLGRLTATPVRRLNRAEQRALWINLYNALTVKVVIDHYPVESIKRISISPGLFAGGPWRKKLVRVEGEELSLDDIEHRILRPIWKDPRIHYAVNCAALGCPNLQADAFTAGNSEYLLSRAAIEFVNHPRGARFDGERLIVSSIYEWFREDFGEGRDRDVILHLAGYADPALADKLFKANAIADHAYDWTLNDPRPTAGGAAIR